MQAQPVRRYPGQLFRHRLCASTPRDVRPDSWSSSARCSVQQLESVARCARVCHLRSLRQDGLEAPAQAAATGTCPLSNPSRHPRPTDNLRHLDAVSGVDFTFVNRSWLGGHCVVVSTRPHAIIYQSTGFVRSPLGHGCCSGILQYRKTRDAGRGPNRDLESGSAVGGPFSENVANDGDKLNGHGNSEVPFRLTASTTLHKLSSRRPGI
jgi:hypothetical protein